MNLKNRFSQTDIEQLVTLKTHDGYKVLIKLMREKIERDQKSHLESPLKEVSFAEIGVSLAKIQGEKNLLDSVIADIDKIYQEYYCKQ